MDKAESLEIFNEMRRLYEVEEWTLEEIGDKFCVSRQAVHNRLARAGMKLRPPVRPVRSVPKQTLERLYTDERLKIKVIAERLQVCEPIIKRELERHKIKKRLRPTSRKTSKNNNERKYPEFYNLKIGDGFDLEPPPKMNAYSMMHCRAFVIGIKVSVKKTGKGMYRVTRLS